MIYPHSSSSSYNVVPDDSFRPITLERYESQLSSTFSSEWNSSMRSSIGTGLTSYPSSFHKSVEPVYSEDRKKSYLHTLHGLHNCSTGAEENYHDASSDVTSPTSSFGEIIPRQYNHNSRFFEIIESDARLAIEIEDLEEQEMEAFRKGSDDQYHLIPKRLSLEKNEMNKSVHKKLSSRFKVFVTKVKDTFTPGPRKVRPLSVRVREGWVE